MSDSLQSHGLQHARLPMSFTISWSLLKLMPIELMMPSNLLILLPSIFPRIRVFASELAFCIRWPKYWSFNFCISSSSEYLGLISFRIDWFDLLVVQGTLKSLLQHHSSKASILQLSYPCMTTRKTIALTSSCQQSNVSNFLIHCLGLSQLFFQGGSIF